MSTDRARELIRKLMAVSESAEKIGSMAEASAFAERAQAMLEECGLEWDDIDGAEVDSRKVEMISFHSAFGDCKRSAYLDLIIAKLGALFCVKLYQCHGRDDVAIIGRPESVSVFADTLIRLRDYAWMCACGTVARDDLPVTDPRKQWCMYHRGDRFDADLRQQVPMCLTVADRLAFVIGFFEGVLHKTSSRSRINSDTNNERGLSLTASELAENTRWANEQFNVNDDVCPGSEPLEVSASAFDAGMAEGMKADV